MYEEADRLITSWFSSYKLQMILLDQQWKDGYSLSRYLGDFTVCFW